MHLAFRLPALLLQLTVHSDKRYTNDSTYFSLSAVLQIAQILSLRTVFYVPTLLCRQLTEFRISGTILIKREGRFSGISDLNTETYISF